jgi:glycosyltransferase involved in cell wall biosynthesis
MPTENIFSLVATVGIGTRNIVSERIDPREQSEMLPVSVLRNVLYRTADAVVVLSERIRPWAETIVPRERVHVIPNPVALSLYGSFPLQQKLPGRTIAAIGRLSPQKGFDVLISAFAQCACEHPNWSLIIVGEGPERSRLTAMIEKLKLENRVTLPGRIQHTIGFLRTVDLFVMSSRYEGFPNVLVEAMACGLPVISTRWNGATEIIQDGIDGILVPPNDPLSLAAAMRRLMSHSDERARLGAQALDVSKRFDLNGIMRLWEDLITDQRRTKSGTQATGQKHSVHARGV